MARILLTFLETVPADVQAALGALLGPRLGAERVPLEPTSIETMLGRSPKEGVVVIHEGAVPAVAAAIAAGAAPGARLAAWMAAAEPLAALQRRFRRRLALLPAGAAIRDPGKAAWKALAHLGREADPEQGEPVKSAPSYTPSYTPAFTPSVAAPSPLDLALARLVVAEDAAALRLDGLLEAAALLPEPVPADPAAAVADLAAVRDRLAAAETGRAEAEAAGQAERALFAGQMAALREELHQRFLAAEAAEARVAELLASTSWRITRPVRAVKLSLAGLSGRKG